MHAQIVETRTKKRRTEIGTPFFFLEILCGFLIVV